MQTNLKHIDFESLDRAMTRFIRNPTRKPSKEPETGFIKTDENGKIMYELEKGGKKIGVMVAGVHPHKDYKIVVGFSMCCKKDKYNWISTRGGRTKVEGFGKTVATKRALKWEEYDKVWFGKIPQEMDDITGIIEIPDTIREPLNKFLLRCKLYYKDKEVPLWVDAMTAIASIKELKKEKK